MNKTAAKILLADDDSLRRVLEFQLQGAGFQVLTAENGAQALETFSNETIDCLITD
ncbi:MAG TPA: hypothetical protein VNI60_10340 [Pyrinomonadaceae bacterium]|nr:hypothetical protein [Pyrinomonadaceae bacterium]